MPNFRQACRRRRGAWSSIKAGDEGQGTGKLTRPSARGWYARYVKRWLDLAIVLPALVVLSPLLLIIAGLVRVGGGAPVLFRQQRPGLDGKPFLLYKFRTMTEGRDGDGRLLPDAARLTRLGRFLRRSSLDELPGLFNVLLGELSIVGPRPLLMLYLGRYSPEHARRHMVRPGITGWAQIHGRQTVRFSQRLKYDLWYVDHVSFMLDVKILLLTIPRWLGSRGVIAGQDVAEVDDLGLSHDYEQLTSLDDANKV